MLKKEGDEMSQVKSHLITGKAFWYKAVGAPVPKYEKPNDAALIDREWVFDLAVDKATVKQLKALGLADKIKNKGDERGDFITFKRNAVKGDNVTQNNPIKMVDHHGNPWNRSVKVGNGSTLNVRFNVYDGRRGKKQVVLAVQVWDLVKYEGSAGNDFPTKPADTEQEFVADDSEFEVAA